MPAYVDFEFYKNEWKGSLIEGEAFPNLSIMASYEVDRITFGRIDEKKLTDEVKFATCAVAEKIHQIKKATDGHLGKKSESVGKQSATYDENMQQGSTGYHKALRHAAYPYLVNTGLLYRGGGLRCLRMLMLRYITRQPARTGIRGCAFRCTA